MKHCLFRPLVQPYQLSIAFTILSVQVTTLPPQLHKIKTCPWLLLIAMLMLFLSLCETVDLKPLHEGLAVVYTDCLPSKDCIVVVEPRIVTEDEFSHDNTLAP